MSSFFSRAWFTVSHALIIAKALNAGDVSGHPLVKDPYNVNKEVEWKQALSTVLTQMKQQEHKNIEVVCSKESKARTACHNIIHHPFMRITSTLDCLRFQQRNLRF
ncbi:unnamed protein product [Victoria cruziana]